METADSQSSACITFELDRALRLPEPLNPLKADKPMNIEPYIRWTPEPGQRQAGYWHTL